MKKIFLTVLAIISLGACAGAPKLTPHFLDTQLGELREYEVVDKKNLTIKYKEAHPFRVGKDDYGNGFFCVPGAQARRWREYCLEQNCTSGGSLLNQQVQKEPTHVNLFMDPSQDRPESLITDEAD